MNQKKVAATLLKIARQHLNAAISNLEEASMVIDAEVIE